MRLARRGLWVQPGRLAPLAQRVLPARRAYRVKRDRQAQLEPLDHRGMSVQPEQLAQLALRV